ncbi:MAG: DNA-binding response regulator [Alphaproteobacteria bacterium]|nr:MAG: DNA-binding response regulator [Alphaproteobacteria bacterium]
MNILLADDHVLFRDALQQFISALKPDWILSQVSNFNEAFDLLKGNPEKFDLVLLDFRMPGMNNLNGLKALVQNFPDQKISIISGVIEEETVHEALSIGACSYFPKTLNGKTLVKAIEIVLDGERFVPLKNYGSQIMPSYYDDDNTRPNNDKQMKKQQSKILDALTPREQDVIQYLAQGLSNKEIANALHLQVATIKLHVSGICKKIGADNRTKAAILAHKYDLVAKIQTLKA